MKNQKKPKSWFDLTATDEDKKALNALQQMQKATFEARERTGKMIATRVKKGKWQIVEIKNVGKSTQEVELTDWISGSQVIDELNSL